MTQTKKCTTCGVTKPLTDYNASIEGKYGVRSQCRDCSREATRKSKAKRKEMDRRIAELEAAARAAVPELPKEVAAPRTFNTVKDAPWDGKLEPIYVRNGGNKHIQSRGF